MIYVEIGRVVSVRNREDWFPRRLMKLMFDWCRRPRLGFLSDTRFSSSGGLYYLYLRGIYSFLFSINYVSICKSQYWYIDIAPVLLEFYFTFPDWTRQHPATNDGTLHGVPFISTSQYLQAQLATFFHRARRPWTTPNASLFLDNYWQIKIRQSNDFLYTNVMWVSVGHFKNVLINKFSCLLVTDSWTPHPHAFWFLHPQNFCLYIL